MKNENQSFSRSLWISRGKSKVIQIIDQRFLPFREVVCDLNTPEDVIRAISNMQVRGAPLIGVTAAFGVYLTLLHFKDNPDREAHIEKTIRKIRQARPTAINLKTAVYLQLNAISGLSNYEKKIEVAFQTALKYMDTEIEACRKIGENGLPLIETLYNKNPSRPVRILTHCNAGWLATIEKGTALAPVYLAHEKNIPVHVWVDETRPRNQGTRLTAWELSQAGVSHSLITDNTGGFLMQQGKVDLVITGSDRTALNGDTANKIGTYLKALAAKDNGVPFFVALPSSSIDWSLENGDKIPIEKRDPDEVLFIEGLSASGKIEKIKIAPDKSMAENYGFDVTPGRLITGLITEKGLCKANRKGILKLFPEKSGL